MSGLATSVRGSQDDDDDDHDDDDDDDDDGGGGGGGGDGDFDIFVQLYREPYSNALRVMTV